MTDQLIAAAERRRTFHTLDALRGLAAIAVVAFHYPELLGPLGVGGAYLAVDLFFLMSGVVIAHAYRARFAAGLSSGAFLRARVARLISSTRSARCSVAAIIAGLVAGLPSRWTWTGLLAALPNLLFLPSPPVAGRSPQLYPLDFPAWSLLYELLVNAVFAVCWSRLRGRRLVLLLLLAAAAVAAVGFGAGRLDGGIYYRDAPVGLARVAFSFFLGVAMQDVAERGGTRRLPPIRMPVPVILTATTGLLCLSVPPAARAGYDVLCVLLLFPVLVWAAIHAEPRRGVAACAALGLVSYPLYTLHVPAKLLVLGASRALSGRDPTLLAPGIGIVALLGLLVVSWLAARYLDPPLRRLAERMLRVRRPSQA